MSRADHRFAKLSIYVFFITALVYYKNIHLKQINS